MLLVDGLSFSVVLKIPQLPRRLCDPYRHTVHHIVSSGSPTIYPYPLRRDSDAACSYLVTKSLQSYAGWSGGYGWDSVLSVLGHFSEKLETSSLWYRHCNFRPLTNFTSAFKYCCRSRGEKLEKTNITYGCLAKVVRDGGFTIALIARLSAIPGHCASLQLLIVRHLTVCSHHRGVQHMWNGDRRVFLCGFTFPPKTIHYRLFGSCS